MRLRLLSRVMVLALTAALAGCGLFDYEEREPWRAQAEAACFARKLVPLSPLIQPAKSLEGKGICGLDRPLRVAALADGTVQIGGRPVLMSCPMTAAIEAWVRHVMLPAAYERYGAPVVEIKQMGTYSCRTRNNVPGARLSEHSFANAFDFSGVVLANGHSVSVKGGWRGSEADRAFLRQILAGACGPFTTVLGPGSDGMHEDHFHLDLARHDVKGTRRYCRPKLQAPGPTPMPEAPDADLPVATLPPSWPKVLPQTLEASRRQDDMLPPVALPPGTVGAGMGGAAPIACPPGYICTPVTDAVPQAVGPASLGWQAGPAGIPLEDGDVTGSIPYEDH